MIPGIVGSGALAASAVTWDPALKNAAVTLSNGSLTAAASANNFFTVYATRGRTSGKYYFEVLFADTACTIGVADSNLLGNNSSQLGDSVHTWSLLPTGDSYHSGTSFGPILSAAGAGVIGLVAVDIDAQSIWWGRNGTFSGNPAAGTGARYADLGALVIPAMSIYQGSATARFAAADLAYAPPSGFLPWQ